MDADTFDRGLLNVAAIQESLKRSSLYVLFLSENSVSSAMVRYEALQAQELVARGVIDRFLVICLDETAFQSADDNWKGFNFVRKAVSAQSIARLIQSRLAVGQAKNRASKQPFVGRLKELSSVKDLLSESGPRMAALYISGNVGIGRRTFARRVFNDRFPAVNQMFPELKVDEFDGTFEIYRKLNELITPVSTLAAYRARIAGFTIANDDQRVRLIAQLFAKLLEARECLFVIDNGGLLTDDGQIERILKNVIELLGSQAYPPMVMIAERMVPRRYRSETPTVIFSSLPSLTSDDLKQLISFKLQDAGVVYRPEDIQRLVELSDGHPFNVQTLIDSIKEHTLKVFLADTTDFSQWKQRQGAAYLKKLVFCDEELRILGGLRDFRGLDFDTLVLLAGSTLTVAGVAVSRLMDLHIIEAAGEILQIAPPLRAAVERDARFALAGKDRREMLKAVSRTLQVDSDSEEVSISMIDAAILATLQEGREIPDTFSAFLFPSHLVWLARRKYHERRYQECIQLSRRALDGSARLSVPGQIEACRYLCLASAHLNQQVDFEHGISTLRKKLSGEARAKSNLHFLLGFNARLGGRLPEAESHMRSAFEASPKNFQATRELASICLLRGDLDSAEHYARIAFDIAPDNVFVLDMMLSVLLKLSKVGRHYSPEEVEALFVKLRRVEDDDVSRSFYETRRAEYELRKGNTSKACRLIDEAVHKTPTIFSVHALRAEIYLEHGNNLVARDEIKHMQGIVYKAEGTERFSNLRPLLDLETSYYRAIGDYQAAKKNYLRTGVYSAKEIEDGVRSVDIEQAFRAKRS